LAPPLGSLGSDENPAGVEGLFTVFDFHGFSGLHIPSID
jgi:hypothetical protein